jgi:uncharacterized SAM-binding protein YcdF (DUF218 family)
MTFASTTSTTTTSLHPARVTRRRRRRPLILVAVALLAIATFCAMTLRLFVFPDLNAPAPSDAIVVLGGSQGDKAVGEGIRLAQEGFAPTLALSVPPSTRCPYRLRAVPNVHLLCFVAEPQTTQGEGRSIARFAGDLHWRRVIVVMPIPQASRARLRIGRCFAGQVLEVGVTPEGPWGWAKEIAYEWGAMFKAVVLQPSC